MSETTTQADKIKKIEEQAEKDVVKFLHDAFCIDGTVEICETSTHPSFKIETVVKFVDKHRGTFYIAMVEPKTT